MLCKLKTTEKLFKLWHFPRYLDCSFKWTVEPTNKAVCTDISSQWPCLEAVPLGTWLTLQPAKTAHYHIQADLISLIRHWAPAGPANQIAVAMFCIADCDASHLLSMKQGLHVQYYLGGEFLCLLCMWQICMGRQAPALLVTATEYAHNGKESCCTKFALPYSESSMC